MNYQHNRKQNRVADLLIHAAIATIQITQAIGIREIKLDIDRGHFQIEIVVSDRHHQPRQCIPAEQAAPQLRPN